MVRHYRFLLVLSGLLYATSALSSDQGAIGIWRTESSDQGYLHVSIQECENYLCGTILLAYDLQDQENPDHEHIDKPMVWDVKSSGRSSWKSGKIWDPSSGKTYKSKMSVENNILHVSGCVLMFCQTQNWTRVQ